MAYMKICVNIKDANEVTQKILNLLVNPKKGMTLKGKEKVLALFNKSEIIEKSHQIYMQLAKG